MRNKLFLVLATLLCANTLYGQINVQPKYDQYSPIEYSLALPPQNAQALWEVKPLDGQTKYTSKKYGDVYAFWGQPGRYELTATVVIVDFDAKTFELKKYDSVFEVDGTNPPPPPPGPEPGPGPPPDPVPPPSPIPNDPFDNLGQRLDSLADQLGLQVDLRNRVAEVYTETASLMTRPGVFISIQQVKDHLETELKKLSLDSSWDKTFLLLKEDAKLRAPMSWEQAYNWYRAAATGYQGRALTIKPAVWFAPNKASSSDGFIVTHPNTTIPATTLCPTGVCNVR